MPGRGSTSSGPPKGAVLLEIQRLGTSLKVTAVDEATGIEVSFAAPASAAQSDIERLARAKLRYVMEKKSGGQ